MRGGAGWDEIMRTKPVGQVGMGTSMCSRAPRVQAYDVDREGTVLVDMSSRTEYDVTETTSSSSSSSSSRFLSRHHCKRISRPSKY